MDFVSPNENDSKSKYNTYFFLSIQSICILKQRELRNTKWESG